MITQSSTHFAPPGEQGEPHGAAHPAARVWGGTAAQNVPSGGVVVFGGSVFGGAVVVDGGGGVLGRVVGVTVEVGGAGGL